VKHPKLLLPATLLCALTFGYGVAQNARNPHGLPVLTTVAELQQTIRADSNKAFGRIADYVPGVILDIKYATTQNVFYTKLYDKPHAYTRLVVAQALASAQ